MDITLLGTGGPIPSPDRAGPSTLVTAGPTRLLIDAGRGVCMRLVAAGVFPLMLDAVLVTHLHSDHLSDLNDVITTRWVMAPVPMPITLYGPPGLRETVDGLLAMLAPDIRYRIAHHEDLTEGPRVEVVEVSPGDTFTVGETSIRVGATDHRPVEPTVAFRVDHDGHSVVLGGDGVPCSGLDELCVGADAYVQTVLREDLVALIPMPRMQDVLDYHSTVTQAAETATRAGVRHLVLTHYIPGLPPGAEEEWRAIAAAAFTGDVILGDDLTTLSL